MNKYVYFLLTYAPQRPCVNPTVIPVCNDNGLDDAGEQGRDDLERQAVQLLNDLEGDEE